jgi:hypothetical protein
MKIKSNFPHPLMPNDINALIASLIIIKAMVTRLNNATPLEIRQACVLSGIGKKLGLSHQITTIPDWHFARGFDFVYRETDYVITADSISFPAEGFHAIIKTLVLLLINAAVDAQSRDAVLNNLTPILDELHKSEEILYDEKIFIEECLAHLGGADSINAAVKRKRTKPATKSDTHAECVVADPEPPKAEQPDSGRAGVVFRGLLPTKRIWVADDGELSD